MVVAVEMAVEVCDDVPDLDKEVVAVDDTVETAESDADDVCVDVALVVCVEVADDVKV